MHGTTYHAPAERASLDDCRRQREILLSRELVFEVLEGYAEPALLLNEHRQVIAANERARELVGAGDEEQMLGDRPGELMGCVNHMSGPAGCGTGPGCIHCGAVGALLKAMETQRDSEQDCRIAHRGRKNGGAFEFCVRAKPLSVEGQSYLMVSFRDTSAARRRAVLERVLQHDLLNAVGGIRGLAEIMVEEDDPQIYRDCAGDILQIASQITDQLDAQRQLTEAEGDELAVSDQEVDGRSLMEEAAHVYRHHPANEGQRIVVGSKGSCLLVTDPTLLSRALGNLLKNAVEAALPGDEIRCQVTRVWHERVVFSIHNAQVMPEAVQRQLFLRSFSTKTRIGRGIGTFGARLLVERYLGGRVSFTSRDREGTTFRIDLPVRRDGRPDEVPSLS